MTNSDSGPKLLAELFIDDWALKRFAGVSNLPADPHPLSRRELAPYEGSYTGQTFDPVLTPPGTVATTKIQLTGTGDGRLAMRRTDNVDAPVVDDPTDVGAPDESPVQSILAFYRADYVLVLDPSGQPTFARANFIRGHDGSVQWLRLGGRLYSHQTA